MNLVDLLIKNGWLETPRIIEAFRKIKRADFMPQEIRALAEIDEAMPIGYGQTISQPAVVAFMLERLQPGCGEKILDVGSGSGWTPALLAHIVSQKGNFESAGRQADSSESCALNSKEIRSEQILNRRAQESKTSKGKIVAVEIVPELKKFGEKNVGKYNFIKKGIAQFICADGSRGYKKEAPYDKILCSAAGKKIPPAWKEQLKTGGKIVAPVKSSIWLLRKKSEREFREKEYPGFIFVPLV